MTKKSTFSLFSTRSLKNRSEKKKAPKSKDLRFEPLESRELLSVNPADYAALRETYADVALPENFEDVNIIELSELTATALQEAINVAAASPEDDLIVVEPAALGENTLSLADATILVDFDASESGAATLVSVGDERLRIAVNPTDYSFNFESGVLNFAGLDFVNVVDLDLLCSVDVEDIESGVVDSVEQDARYFDGAGIEIIEETYDEPESDDASDADSLIRSFDDFYAQKDGVALESQESSLQTPTEWTDNYAIIFIGLVKYSGNFFRKIGLVSQEDDINKRMVTKLYNSLVDDYGLLPKDIHVFYADGSSQFLNGVKIQAASQWNLEACIDKLSIQMNRNSRLLTFIDNHGGGGTSALGDEFFCTDNGGAIYASEFARMLTKIKSGYVTCAIGCCYSGGVLEATKNEILTNYNGKAHFSIGAAAPYNETSTYSSRAVPKLKIKWRGFKTKIYIWIDYDDRSWSNSFVNALDSGVRSSFGLFCSAENNYFALTWTDHPYHWGENICVFGSTTSSLSVPAPSLASVSDKTITVSWNPSNTHGLPSGEVDYVVGWRERGSDHWNSVTVSASDYLSHGKSFTINSFDGRELRGGTTYDVGVYAKYRDQRSRSSYNLVVTTNKRLAESLFGVVNNPWNRSTGLSYTTTCHANEIGVALTAKSSDASSYTIRWRNLETNEEKSAIIGARQSNYTIKGLLDGARYEIAVKANGGKYDVNITGNRFKFVDSEWRVKTVYTPKKLIASDLRMGDDASDLLATVTPTGDVSWRGGMIDNSDASQLKGFEYRYRTVGASDNAWKYNDRGPNLPSGEYEVQYRAIGNGLTNGSRYATETSAWVSFVTHTSKRQILSSLSDSSADKGSLRYVLSDSVLAHNDLIIFDPSKLGANATITLTAPITVNKSVILDASRCMNADGTPGITIDANGHQAFNFTSGAANVSLNGIRIINASTTGDGGAIRSDAQNLTIMNCAFEDNYASHGAAVFVNEKSAKEPTIIISKSVFSGNDTLNSGGAIFFNGDANSNDARKGSITISNSRFVNNTGYSSTNQDNALHGGGAIFVDIDNVAPVTIRGCEFIGNESINYRGGAIAFGAGSIATITDSVFDGNTALWHGGAIEAWSSNVTIDGSLFTGNSSTDATNGFGGAYSAIQSTTKITRSEFVDNYANQQGGAIYIGGGSSAIDVASFHGNSARGSGGAMKMAWSRNTLYNALLYGNSVVVDAGGAIQLSSTGATSDTETSLSVNNTTIVDNSAPNAHAIEVFTRSSGKAATLNVTNSVVLPSAEGVALGLVGTAANVTATNVLSTNPSEWTSRTNFWTYDPSKPLFTDAANGDYTLAANSQAIGRGQDYYASRDESTVDGWRDLAGLPRQVGKRVDLGAYECQEYEPREWTVTTTTDSASDAGSLRYAIVNSHEGDTILFDESLAGKTITLNGELAIVEGITIDATNLYDAENAQPGVTISGNYASRVFNILKDAGDVTLRGLSIANGDADSGGGIYKAANSNLTLENCLVVNNIAETGGGGGVYAEGGELHVVDSTFRSNRTLSAVNSLETRGGAAFLRNCVAKVVSSTFVGNKSQFIVGAILATNLSRLDVESSTFTQNVSVSDGASAIEWVNGSVGSVRNSLFYRNTSPGGDVLQLSGSGSLSAIELTVENTTVVNNLTSSTTVSRPAVNMYTQASNYPATVNVINSIVAFNNGSQYGSVGTANLQTFNICNSLANQSVNAANGNIYYTGSINALFTDAANDDYTLNPDSVAINAGSNDYVTSETDFGGSTRIQAGRVDIGAFETVEGRTIVVTTASDDASDEGSLRYAVENARHGDYVIFSDALKGKTITLTSPLEITKALTIDASVFLADGSVEEDETPAVDAPANAYNDGLALSGAGASKILTINAPGQEVTIVGLTFAQGYSRNDGSSAASPAGGSALYNMNANVTVRDAYFVDNVASYGGAILNKADMTFENVEFANNSAYYGGGAVFNASGATVAFDGSKMTGNVADEYVSGLTNVPRQSDETGKYRNGGALLNFGAATLSSTTLSGNRTHGTSGGALYSRGATAVVTITGSTITNNESPQVGGAIENSLGTLTIVDSVLADNTAISGNNGNAPAGGGAIFNNQGTLTVESSEFTGNASQNYYGGAIYSFEGRLEVSDSVFSLNTAGILNGAYVPESGTNYGGGNGGAIFVHSKHMSRYSTATLTNTVIERNDACYGGGLCAQNATIDLYNCDVVNNASQFGAGGIYVDAANVLDDPDTDSGMKPSTVTAHNTLVVMNRVYGADEYYDVYNGNVTATVNGSSVKSALIADYALTGKLTRYDWTNSADDQKLVDYVGVLPLFADEDALISGDLRLAENSQAFNKGGMEVASPTDLAGAPRVAFGRVDLGAYELQSYEPRVLTVRNTSNGVETIDSLPYVLAEARDGDTIVFAPGLKGKTITLDGELVIDQSITIDASALYDATTPYVSGNYDASKEPGDLGTPGVTLSGGGSSRIFRIDPFAADVTIIGVKFANGKTTQTSNNQSPKEFYGGAIYEENVDLTIENCVFENNQGLGRGGAIYANYSKPMNGVVVKNVQFINNSVKKDSESNGTQTANQGGALQISAFSSPSGHTASLKVSDSIFYGNSTEDDGTFVAGGAIYTYWIDGEIERSVFKKNSSRYGGAIFEDGGNWTISNSIFAENTALHDGAAIEVYGRSSRHTNLRLYNSTVVGNVSANDVGAVRVWAGEGARSRFEAYNSIIAYNAESYASNSKADVKTYVQTGSVVETVARNVLTNYTGWTDAKSDGYDYVSTSNYPVNRVLYTTWDEATDRPQYALRSGIAVNHRNPSEPDRFAKYVVTDTDLAGRKRVAGTGVDMGAYEYNSAAPALASVAIAGDLLVDSPLEVRYAEGFAPTATYQWFRASQANAAQNVWSAVKGATDSVYVPTLNDAGYCFKVVATGFGAFAGSIVEAQTSDFVATTLETPTAAFVASGPNYAIVSWGAIARASRYAISYRPVGSEEAWTTLTFAKNAPEVIVEGDVLAYRVEGLAANTGYEFTVQARGNNTSLVHSEKSEPVVGVTTDDSILLDGVLGDYEAGGVLTATLDTKDASASYQWYSLGANGEWGEIAGANSASYQTTSADVGKRFMVVATADGNDGYTGDDFAASETVVWTRLASPQIRLDSTTENSITIAWPTVANATGYVIAARVVGEESWEVSPEFDADETSCTLEELEPGQTYEVRVMAVGDGDVYASSEYSASVTARPGDAVAGDISVSYDAATRQATLEWDAIDGAAKYQVKISKDGGATWSTYKSNLTATGTVVNGVYVGKTYGYRVYGFDSTGKTLDDYLERTFAPFSLTSTVTAYAPGDTLSVTLTPADASADVRWYNLTSGGYVEIPEAAGQLTYAPSSATSVVKVVATGAGDSLGASATLTFAPESLGSVSLTRYTYTEDTHQALVKWPKIEGAAFYTLEFSQDGGETWKVYQKNFKNNYKGVNNVYPGKSYDFRVTALDASKQPLSPVYIEGTFAPMIVTSPAENYNAGVPITLTKIGTENATATIKWYQVTANGDVEIKSARNQLSYTPTSAEYDLKVVSTGTGDSLKSNYELVIKAQSDIAFAFDYNASTRKADVTWDAIAGATSYVVKISKDGGASWTTYKSGLTTPEVTVSGLYSGKTYGFRVLGQKSNEDGTKSTIATYQTTFSPGASSTSVLDDVFADYFEDELFDEEFVEF